MLLFTSSKNQKRFKAETEKFFNKAFQENDFIPDKSTLLFDSKYAIALNEKMGKIAILSRENLSDEFNYKEIEFRDIIESKVIKNNETITSSSFGSQVTRGIVGGVALGGLGTLIGATTGKTNSKEKIKELSLEIVINDLLNPRVVIPFYKSDVGLDVLNENSKAIINTIEDWYRSLTVIIERNKSMRSV